MFGGDKADPGAEDFEPRVGAEAETIPTDSLGGLRILAEELGLPEPNLTNFLKQAENDHDTEPQMSPEKALLMAQQSVEYVEDATGSRIASPGREELIDALTAYYSSPESRES